MSRGIGISTPEFVSRQGDGWRLAVWVQPGARESGVAGEYQGCVKIRLQAPAVDNKANKALVAFVAKLLNMKKSRVTIEAGHSSRRKLLALDTAEAPDWESLFPSGGPRQP